MLYGTGCSRITHGRSGRRRRVPSSVEHHSFAPESITPSRFYDAVVEHRWSHPTARQWERMSPAVIGSFEETCAVSLFLAVAANVLTKARQPMSHLRTICSRSWVWHSDRKLRRLARRARWPAGSIGGEDRFGIREYCLACWRMRTLYRSGAIPNRVVNCPSAGPSPSACRRGLVLQAPPMEPRSSSSTSVTGLA
jgi:hypothetical protein